MYFPEQIKEAFREDFSEIDNFGFVNNPTTVITDFIQVGTLELRGIGVPSITAAQYIEESYQHAIDHDCICIDIYIFAHSQGAAILNNALPLIPEKIKPYLRILTLGGEQFVYEKSLGHIRNYNSQKDPIPEWSPWNWTIPSESIPGEKWFEHPRKYYIQYWKDHGLPEDFVRKHNDLSN